MAAPVHLALGDSAAGCLRAAGRLHGLPGTVSVIPDDLGHGPLDDGRARIEYFRACHEGYDEWQSATTDAFEPWRAWRTRLDVDRPAPAVIWSGPNASEAVLLAMACWWLRDWDAPLVHVTVPPAVGSCHVASCSPGVLKGLYDERKVLSDVERASRMAEFDGLRHDPRLRRCWERGRAVAMPIDRFDPMLFDACTATWHRAVRVVGAAMQQTDIHHSVSDLFFSSRLQALIRAGRIDADGPRRRLGEYSVRRTTAS